MRGSIFFVLIRIWCNWLTNISSLVRFLQKFLNCISEDEKLHDIYRTPARTTQLGSRYCTVDGAHINTNAFVLVLCSSWSQGLCIAFRNPVKEFIAVVLGHATILVEIIRNWYFCPNFFCSRLLAIPLVQIQHYQVLKIHFQDWSSTIKLQSPIIDLVAFAFLLSWIFHSFISSFDPGN